MLRRRPVDQCDSQPGMNFLQGASAGTRYRGDPRQRFGGVANGLQPSGLAPAGNMDEYVEYSTQGYGSRVGNSCCGVVFGFLLFFGAFWVLTWNEGQIDGSIIAKATLDIPSAGQPDLKIGTAISTTGSLGTTEKLGDDLFLKPGDYVALNRNSEMFAWTETQSSESHTDVGGQKTTKTTYKYSTQWTSAPSGSGSFKVQEGHQNPDMAIGGGSYHVSKVSIGIFSVVMDRLSYPVPSKVELSSGNTVLSKDVELMDGYIYRPYFGFNSTEPLPQVGDVRVSYTALPAGVSVTVFGAVGAGNTLGPYVEPRTEYRLYRLFLGSREDAIAQMHGEHILRLWILRVVGFFMMYFGLSMIMSPLAVLVSVIPFLESITGSIASFIAFGISFTLTLLTIFIYKFTHSIWGLLITLGVVGGAGVYYYRKKAAAKRAAGAGPQQGPGGPSQQQWGPPGSAPYPAEPGIPGAPYPAGGPAQQPYGGPAQQPYGAPAPQPYPAYPSSNPYPQGAGEPYPPSFGGQNAPYPNAAPYGAPYPPAPGGVAQGIPVYGGAPYPPAGASAAPYPDPYKR